MTLAGVAEARDIVLHFSEEAGVALSKVSMPCLLSTLKSSTQLTLESMRVPVFAHLHFLTLCHTGIVKPFGVEGRGEVTKTKDTVCIYDSRGLCASTE